MLEICHHVALSEFQMICDILPLTMQNASNTRHFIRMPWHFYLLVYVYVICVHMCIHMYVYMLYAYVCVHMFVDEHVCANAHVCTHMEAQCSPQVSSLIPFHFLYCSRVSQ